MIELDIKYSGTGHNGKPCFIILHDETFDICSPAYRGGNVETLDYSTVKHVCASGDALIIKIKRTEVVLPGIGSEDANGLTQVIEIGRNKPIEGSKEFRKYQKMAEKTQARAERRQVRVERFAAVVDGINRYREQSNEEERMEREREEEKQRQEEARVAAQEQKIEQQVILTTDTEDEALAKILTLNKLFAKCLHEPGYSSLVSLVMRTCEDNLTVLKMSHPSSSVTAKAEEQLQQFIKDKKKDDRDRNISGALILLGIIAFFVMVYFID